MMNSLSRLSTKAEKLPHTKAPFIMHIPKVKSTAQSGFLLNDKLKLGTCCNEEFKRIEKLEITQKSSSRQEQNTNDNKKMVKFIEDASGWTPTCSIVPVQKQAVGFNMKISASLKKYPRNLNKPDVFDYTN